MNSRTLPVFCQVQETGRVLEKEPVNNEVEKDIIIQKTTRKLLPMGKQFRTDKTKS